LKLKNCNIFNSGFFEKVEGVQYRGKLRGTKMLEERYIFTVCKSSSPDPGPACPPICGACYDFDKECFIYEITTIEDFYLLLSQAPAFRVDTPTYQGPGAITILDGDVEQ